MSTNKFNNDEKKFGEELRRIRKQRNLTLKQLGQLLEISHSFIGFIETGERVAEGIYKSTIENWMYSYQELSKVKLLPVFATVPAGWPVDCHVAEEPIAYVPFEGNGRNKGALLVSGHSMHPEIKDGEFVVYVEDYDIKPGDRVVVTNEFNKPMVKEYAVKNGEPWLISINPEYSNHKVNEGYTIIGRVIEVFNKRKVGRG